MVVDSSVIVAIALVEEPADWLVAKIRAGNAIVAAPTVLEAHMVLRALLGEDATRALGAILTEFQIGIVPFGTEHCRQACVAFDTFGKGRHAAGLNFGDCFSYALSKVSGQPLLFVGQDFSQTDVAIA